MAELVEFVFFIIFSDCNQYKRVLQRIFSFDFKEICFFYGYFEDI